METIFMNTENSKTNESRRFKLDLAYKLNLKNPKKNMNLKYLLQLGMKLLIYLIVLILLMIYRTTLNLS